MKSSVALAIAVILALAFNIEWEWHPSETSTVNFVGPPAGILLCAIICIVLIYRTFLAIEDLLIAKGYLAERTTTALDRLPWIVVLPFALVYITRGDDWYFKWGESDLKLWYFLALLTSVFALRIFTVVRRVADRARDGV